MHRRRGWSSFFDGTTRSCFLPCCLGEELFEVLEKIWRSVEKSGDLRIDIRDGLGFSLVGLQDFEKLLIYLGLVLEAVLLEVER
jgi:hypothetical protein